VLAALKRAAGDALAQFTVGHPANRRNPKTGAPEFDDPKDGAMEPSGLSEWPSDPAPDQTAGSGYEPVADSSASLQQPPGLHRFPKKPYYMPAAEAVYGETGSLRPQLIDPSKSAEDPSNWQPSSAARLAEGRADIAGLYQTNHIMNRRQPTDFMNPIQMREWESALGAAAEAPIAEAKLGPQIDALYIRQEGKPKPHRPYATIDTIGPFRKRGAGDVPRGDAAYLDFGKWLPK
jgi:hypothetical protein